MELIQYYAFLALVVALAASVDLFIPVVRQIEESAIYKGTLYITLFTLSLLIAPVLIYPCLNKLKGIEFRDALLKSLTDKN